MYFFQSRRVSGKGRTSRVALRRPSVLGPVTGTHVLVRSVVKGPARRRDPGTRDPPRAGVPQPPTSFTPQPEDPIGHSGDGSEPGRKTHGVSLASLLQLNLSSPPLPLPSPLRT